MLAHHLHVLFEFCQTFVQFYEVFDGQFDWLKKKYRFQSHVFQLEILTKTQLYTYIFIADSERIIAFSKDLFFTSPEADMAFADDLEVGGARQVGIDVL